MPRGLGSLADVLLIRIEQLSETAQQVLRTAAVAGRRVEHDLLRDAVQLPQEELESALREAVGRQLLLPGDDATYSFRHALTREAVYADLLPGERVRLHGLFARLLAEEGRPAESAAERAHHSRESHDLTDALAASLEAADHAQRVGAPAEELRHLETALELWPAVDASARPETVGTITLTLRASAAAARAGERPSRGPAHPLRARAGRRGHRLRTGRPSALHARGRSDAHRRPADALHLQQRGARADPGGAALVHLGVGGRHPCHGRAVRGAGRGRRAGRPAGAGDRGACSDSPTPRPT